MVARETIMRPVTEEIVEDLKAKCERADILIKDEERFSLPMNPHGRSGPTAASITFTIMEKSDRDYAAING